MNQITKDSGTISIVIIIVLFLPTFLYLQPQDLQFEHVSVDEITKPSNWVGRGGVWNFSEKVITAQATVDWNKAYYKSKNFKNFIFEVKLRKTGESGPCGLVFHYNEEPDEGYYLLIYPYGGISIKRFKQENVKIIFIGSSAFLNYGLNIWNTVKLICKDSNCEVNINGKHILSFKDTTYVSGKLGLYIDGDPRQRAEFIIISMKELNSSQSKFMYHSQVDVHHSADSHFVELKIPKSKLMFKQEFNMILFSTSNTNTPTPAIDTVPTDTAAHKQYHAGMEYANTLSNFYM